MGDSIAFSEEQQAAILGHAFIDPTKWQQLDELKLVKEWLVSARLVEMFDHHVAYRKWAGRPPRPRELVEYVHVQDPGIVAESVKRTVAFCVDLAKQMGWDDLRLKFTDWVKSRVVINDTMAISEVYNSGDHTKAFDMAKEMATKLTALDAGRGQAADSLESAADRVDEEEAEREEDSKNILQYGISFLDDALGGIIRKELIMVGARTGAGKTELATMIARHNAKQGKRVAFFALEAEKYEIERRIKFSMMGERWRRDNPDVLAGSVISYADFRMWKLEKCFDKYKKEVRAEFKHDYKTLRTFYRVNGDFSPKELDREILKIHKEVDLVILDHIHYVDLEGENENAEMKNLIKQLRRLALSLGIPILCVAHFRKKQGNEAKSLTPDLEAFHGSSDITKIATTSIVLAPCYGLASTEPTALGQPTFMRIVKFRLGGNRLSSIAISFFDIETNTYREKYALGRFNLSETKWTPIIGEPPKWATRCGVREVSEVD